MVKESDFLKIRTAVPTANAGTVREAFGLNGAGMQGHYDYCSGSYKQVGRFRPLKGAKPSIGTIGRVEEVEEEVIETICHKDNLRRVIQAIKEAHPYEEPSIDIIPRLELD